MNNKGVYDKAARYYATWHFVQKAEMEILNYLIAHKLKDMRMLDIGIGGGRTTEVFFPFVKEYIGIDYSTEMVNICRRKFEGKIGGGSFQECDFCDMRIFRDNSFDVVLFSFNGIDSVGYEERLRGLREVYRVLKPDGFFCFSTHNIEWTGIYGCYHIAFRDGTMNPIKYSYHLVNRAVEFCRVRVANRTASMKKVIDGIKRGGYGTFYDGVHRGRLLLYYTTHENQLRQLQECQFGRIKTYSVDGVETNDQKKLNGGAWIYYVARK